MSKKESTLINSVNGLFLGWLNGLVDVGFSEGARANSGMIYKQFYSLSAKRQSAIVRMAEKNSFGAYKFVKGAAKLGAGTTVLMSIAYGVDAYANDRPDKNRRYIKALMDVGVAGLCLFYFSSPV